MPLQVDYIARYMRGWRIQEHKLFHGRTVHELHPLPFGGLQVRPALPVPSYLLLKPLATLIPTTVSTHDSQALICWQHGHTDQLQG
jgi:hypothetical protein